jgi:hypothetical protein
MTAGLAYDYACSVVQRRRAFHALWFLLHVSAALLALLAAMAHAASATHHYVEVRRWR